MDRHEARVEWSLSRGLLRASAWLLLVVAICMPVWALVLFLGRAQLNWIATTAASSMLGLLGFGIVASVAALVPAYVIGASASYRLTERVGCEGLIPTMLGAGASWACVLGGACLAELFGDPLLWFAGLLIMATGLEATVIVLWRTWLNPE